METFACPKGHVSSDPEYCSECGAKIASAPAGAAAAQALGRRMLCPDCGVPREHEDVLFCDLCGYNFASGAHGQVPIAGQPGGAPPAAASSPSPGPHPAAVPAARWFVEVTVDPLLRQDGSPEPPADLIASRVELTGPVSLVGRRSEVRAIFPEIALNFDDAVSHRHALLQLNAEGALTLRDIGSANGTRLNGREVTAMVDCPLTEGDRISVGHWSALTIVHED